MIVTIFNKSISACGRHLSALNTHAADALQIRAAELGRSVPELISELATLDSEPRAAVGEEIAELDRRCARATEDSRMPHHRVVQWLRTR